MTEPLLDIRDFRVSFDILQGRLPAVRGVDLRIGAGETVGLVGESGSGKSALARALLRLNQPPFTAPRTRIEGAALLATPGEADLDLVTASEDQMRRVRARSVAMVFQDALSGLNPLRRNGAQLAEALLARAPGLDRAEVTRATLAMLAEVGLRDPGGQARKFPHQLSGGQRQRVMIALAAIREPALLIADEPTTALDATVQARILDLLGLLRARIGMAMLFISHDLDVVARIADRVAVMYAGQIVELAPATALFGTPRHPYTRALLRSRPGRRDRSQRLTGAPPDPMRLPQGCAFAPRCPLAGDICAQPPQLVDGLRCHRAER